MGAVSVRVRALGTTISSSPLYTPTLDQAIDCQPLTVAPVTPLLEVITLMSQSPFSRCDLPAAIADPLQTVEPPAPAARSSCALVVEDGQVQGIFTERDIVRLTAQGIDFSELTIAEVMIHPVKTLVESDLQDIFAVLFLFRRYRIRHLPIVNQQAHIVGVVSADSLRQVLKPANLLKVRRVAEVMSHHVVQADLQVSVLTLAKLMASRRVSCVVITEQDESADYPQPVGILTERDIVQFQSLQLNLAQVQAATVMSTPLFLLSPEDSLWMVHQEMQRRRVRRFVVSWNWGQGLGIVTQSSLLRVFDPMEMYSIIESLQRTIEQLETEKAAHWSRQQPVEPVPPTAPDRVSFPVMTGE